MPALTILINPAVIHPKAKQKRICFSSTPASHHHIFRSPALSSACLYICATLSTSPHLFSPLSVLLQCASFSPHIHSPLSMFLPLHPSRSSFTLQYHTRSVSPISLRRCLFVSTSPPGLRAAHVPPWARALREPEILMATGEGHLRHTLQGVQARAAVTLSQSGWTSVKRTGLPRQMEARWREANEEKWWRMCVCACKNHAIPAASWLRHMRPVVCFRVIQSFVRGRACTERVDSWAWLCPYSVH